MNTSDNQLQLSASTSQDIPTHSTANKNIPIETLKALAIRGMSYREIAKLANCDVANAYRRLGPYLDEIEIAKDYINNEGSYLVGKEVKILNSINGDDPKDDRDRAVTLAVLFDKRRVASGKSTSNIEVTHVADPAIISAIHAAISAYSGSIAGQITAAAEAEIVDVDAEAEDAPMLEETGIEQ